MGFERYAGHPRATDSLSAPAFLHLVRGPKSEDGEGRQQLLSRLKQRLGVLNSSLRLVLRGRLAGPCGVLEFVASSPHRPKRPEPVTELGPERHLDCVVPA